MAKSKLPEMTEEWKDVVGFEGIYLVSSHGKILSKKKLLKPHVNRGGYERVTLCKNGQSKQMSVHSVVMEAFVGPRPEGYQVDHLDFNKRNNNLNNLRYCTQQENLKRNIGTPSHMTGELHGHSKLTEADVNLIRLMPTVSSSAFARLFGVNKDTVAKVRRGQTWRAALAQTGGV